MKKKCLLKPYFKCKRKEGLVTEICRDSTCEWFLKKEAFLNCTWVACNFGPFTLEEVGAMMGVTRERIRQIEAGALNRLQLKKRIERLRDISDEIGRN
jgi:hypothetical protein